MALKATIFKAVLNIADLDRGVYLDANLTLARHPSETDLRLIVRLLAWALNAHDDLAFTKGLCADDEPELWLKNLHGGIEHWIEVGLPDERRLKKGCNRSEQVTLYTYAGRAVDLWWQQNQALLNRQDNLRIIDFSEEELAPLVDLAERNMQWQVTISEGQVFINSGDVNLSITPSIRKEWA
ncbi:MAG: YaeQ family protein [Tolumonas sp.]|uniref:YaeQ family protein n=1 Tax=uncultured Tolumonas sp. TaxID=263765 RepID=UPI002A0A5219|nr:YaeQ family protein [uncultured Tolumonas sp.]MDD2343342.1 YaeQ family protein [Tolumonas sp.]